LQRWRLDHLSCHSFNVLPTWQKATAFRLASTSGFSRTLRWLRPAPTPALSAPTTTSTAVKFWRRCRTSFSSPVFAGGLAVAEQQLISNGQITQSNGFYRLGRINDRLYQQNGRSDVWYDVLTGNAGTLPNGQADVCTPGWDTVTGWGRSTGWDSRTPSHRLWPSILRQSPSMTVRTSRDWQRSIAGCCGQQFLHGQLGCERGRSGRRSAGDLQGACNRRERSLVGGQGDRRGAVGCVELYLCVRQHDQDLRPVTTTAMNGSEVSVAIPLSTPSKYISSTDRSSWSIAPCSQPGWAARRSS